MKELMIKWGNLLHFKRFIIIVNMLRNIIMKITDPGIWLKGTQSSPCTQLNKEGSRQGLNGRQHGNAPMYAYYPYYEFHNR